jgi:hypothetical protein
MDKEKELIDQAERIRKGYASVMEDEEEEQLSFLDEINKLIRIIFKDAPIDVYTVLTQGQLEKWKKQKYKRAFKKFFSSVSIPRISYFILLATITAFLVSEAIPFYAIGAKVTAKTWVKAILTEVCFIFLSGYRSKGLVETLSVGVLRVAIFCLMLFVITSEVVLQGTGEVAKINNIQTQISTIEQQIKSKEVEIKFYMDKGWGNNTRQRVLERDKLAEQLRELKERQIEEGASKEVSSLIRYKTYGKAIFRLILMFISVLVSRRIFKF